MSCPRRVASLFDQLNIGRRVRECVARDVPFVHRDMVALRLSPEDAFYLHAVVGCLVVYAYERVWLVITVTIIITEVGDTWSSLEINFGRYCAKILVLRLV